MTLSFHLMVTRVLASCRPPLFVYFQYISHLKRISLINLLIYLNVLPNNTPKQQLIISPPDLHHACIYRYINTFGTLSPNRLCHGVLPPVVPARGDCPTIHPVCKGDKWLINKCSLALILFCHFKLNLREHQRCLSHTQWPRRLVVKHYPVIQIVLLFLGQGSRHWYTL